MKKIRLIAVLLAAIFIFASCAQSTPTETTDQTTENTRQSAGTSASSTESTAATAGTTTAEPIVLDDPEIGSGTAAEFIITDEEGVALVPSDNVYTITTSGKYTATGKLDGGCIKVNAADSDEIEIILSDASITSETDAPIAVIKASDVEITAKKGTYNEIIDKRTGTPADDEPDSAIYSKCDLSLGGKGTLIVSSAFDNGIKTKDDLKIKNLTLKVTSVGNALKGNDSVSVSSGNIIAISTGSDGIKTDNSDVSSKGKQRGIVSITGGHIDIYAACDGIQASYDAVISGDDTIVNVFTGEFSEYSSEVKSGDKFYLVVSYGVYRQIYDYYGYFYNENEGKWVKFTYDSMVYSGRTAFYGLTAKVPSGYDNAIFYVVSPDQTPDGQKYVACTDGEPVNKDKNGYLISSISSSSIVGEWVGISSSTNASGKTTYSSKGIKASNAIDISGGSVIIKCTDDGLHANMGDELENGSKGVGNIIISGGSVTITSYDDGIHADNELTISGGNVNVVKSHEGLEGNVIEISGGTTYVNGNDDGINACKGNSTPLVSISGGYVDVTTPSGDTDAIDSNGNISISGGFVIVKGGSSSGMVAGSVDADGKVTVTGGTIIAFGGICETPASGSVNTYISGGTSFEAGDYFLTDQNGETVLSFALGSSYKSVWISSEKIALGLTYSLKCRDKTVISWTQSTNTTGSAGNQGGFGPGRGGMGPGR